MIKFSRTTTWYSGWQGKQNATDIFIDGDNCGTIRGRANTATPGAMHYGVTCKDISFDCNSLKDAKERVRKAFDRPAHRQEGTQAEFDRYIAGDRGIGRTR